MSDVSNLDEVVSNNLMVASVQENKEFWRDTVRSLDRTSEPINQCIEDSRCTEYIDGTEYY